MKQRHLIDEWHDRLILELRDREVPGPRIGDVLAEIDTHCRDTGEDPATAFGDPVAYAREVAGAERVRPSSSWSVALQAAASLAAMLAVVAGIDAVSHGRSATVTAGDLSAIVIGSAGVTVAMATLTRIASNGWWAALVGAMLAPTVIAPILWRAPVAHAPGWPLLLLGVAVLAAAWWPRAADRVLDPRTGREPFGSSLALTVVQWLPLALLAATAGITVLLPG